MKDKLYSQKENLKKICMNIFAIWRILTLKYFPIKVKCLPWVQMPYSFSLRYWIGMKIRNIHKTWSPVISACKELRVRQEREINNYDVIRSVFRNNFWKVGVERGIYRRLCKGDIWSPLQRRGSWSPKEDRKDSKKEHTYFALSLEHKGERVKYVWGIWTKIISNHIEHTKNIIFTQQENRKLSDFKQSNNR